MNLTGIKQSHFKWWNLSMLFDDVRQKNCCFKKLTISLFTSQFKLPDAACRKDTGSNLLYDQKTTVE